MTKFCLEISGDYACYTRPEMKVERTSYDVMTPSCARAIFQAIFWKPPVDWQIEQIDVLNPIEWLNIRRNEVSDVVSTATVKSAMKKGSGNLSLYIEDKRQQRASLILKNVRYRVHARMNFLAEHMPSDDTPGKYYAMFERRAKAGQTFHHPYLGCREFAARFKWVDLTDKTMEAPIHESRDLSWMLYDLDYTDRESPKPLFFKAVMENGTLRVPARNSEAVRG